MPQRAGRLAAGLLLAIAWLGSSARAGAENAGYDFTPDQASVPCGDRAEPVDSPGIEPSLSIERVLVLGDSIIAWRGEPPRGGQFDVLLCLASNDPGLSSASMDIRGVPGQTIVTQPEYSDSRAATLMTFVEDLFAVPNDVPDTVIVTPSVNEFNVVAARNRLMRVAIAVKGIETAVWALRDAGVVNVFVMPMPNVAAQWARYSGDGGRASADVALFNDVMVASGFVPSGLSYGLDANGDGLGDSEFFDDIPAFPGADTYDGAHPDADGHDLIGTTTYRRLAALT